MRKASSVVAALLLANPLSVPWALASEAPLYCKYRPSRGLRPEQEEVCKKHQLTVDGEDLDKVDKVAEEKTADPLPEVSYPLFSQGAILAEGLPPLFVSIEAKDSSAVKMWWLARANKNRESFELDPTLPLNLAGRDVEFWGRADMSGVEFKMGQAVANTAGWITGAVIGSIGTGGLALPFFLLAAPFVGASSATQYTPDHRLVVRYFDETDGNVKLFTLQMFDKTKFLELSSVLNEMTGLEAGQKREKVDYSIRRQELLAQKELELDEIKVSLMQVDRRKPWCSKLDLTGETGSVDAYESKLKEVDALREMLDLPEYVETASAGSEEKWKRHLEENPNLAIWVKANPIPAKKVKAC